MSGLSFGRDTLGRSSVAARAAGAAMLVLLAWFVLAPGSLALVWGVGYAAIIVGFLYRQWAHSPYVAHEPTGREIASVVAIALLWTAVVVALYLVVLAIRFVIGSIAGVLAMLFGP